MERTALHPDSAIRRPSGVDTARLMADVQTLADLSLEGRRTGSPGNHRAQALILGRFQQLGLRAVGNSFEQKFSFVHQSLKGLLLPGRPFKEEFPDATNLMAVLPGAEAASPFLLLSAHYDHLGVRDGQIYPGADDNASGVAAMLATASVFAAHPLRHPILFVAFDGEEQGLQGSEHFAGHPPIDLKNITLAINLDMVSRGDDGVIVASGTRFDPSLRDLVTKSARGRDLTVQFGHDRPFYLAGRVEDWTYQSDQGPLHDAGVRTLYYGVEDHDDYHAPTDTPDRIPRAFFTEVASLVIETLRAADGGP